MVQGIFQSNAAITDIAIIIGKMFIVSFPDVETFNIIDTTATEDKNSTDTAENDSTETTPMEEDDSTETAATTTELATEAEFS